MQQYLGHSLCKNLQMRDIRESGGGTERYNDFSVMKNT